VLIAAGCLAVRELLEDEDWRVLLLSLHKSFGFCFLWLSAVRLACRHFFYKVHRHELPLALRLAARFSHITLYILIIAVPLSGWLFSSAAGKPIHFFGLINIPSLMAKNRDLAETLGEAHEFLAWFFLISIVVHMLAALWHHFMRKDHILLSMTFIKQK
jgi:cytochrome b561